MKIPFINKLDKEGVKVVDMWGAAKDSRASLGLTDEWRTYEDYCRNNQNPAETDTDPGSVTNVIFPIIASQVADLVDEPLDTMVTGEEPSDEVFAKDVGHFLDWVIYKNKMFFKIDRHEWRRLKFGTAGWKIWFDPRTKLILIDPFNPVNFFPDPKIKEAMYLQEGDFMAHAVYTSIPALRRQYGNVANKLKPEKLSTGDLQIFDGEDADEARDVVSNKTRVIEMWTKDSQNRLRRQIIGGEGIVLYDNKKDNYTSFYEHGRYPFIVDTCYDVEGRIWGMGDAELLKPTQDLINDLDDQIRLNARLMGNVQMVVGLASGINIKKWVAKAGLRIPARDPNAWKMVQPPSLPSYITDRRLQALTEAEIISGRPDIVEGRRSGVRAASAIMALQESGQRRARHKKMALQESLGQCMEYCVDYLKEFYTEEQAFRIIGRSAEASGAPPSYVWFKGSKLKNIPKLIPDGVDGGLKVLLDKDGKEMTKDAKFDLRISIGAGLPHNKGFLFNALQDQVKEGIITREEARGFMKDVLDWPVANPSEPVGNNFGMGPVMPGGRSGMIPQGAGTQMPPQTDGVGIPPEILEQLMATVGGGMA